MPPLLVIQSILFIFISFFHPVFSENVTSVCPVPLSPLLQQLPTGINQYPTCSLSSRPADPAPEFLSFEEWKAKQLAEQDASNREKESYTTAIAPPTQTQNEQSSNEIARKSKRRSMSDQEAIIGENTVPSSSEKQREVGAASSPRSHIPLIDRFNYASNECNARIHSSHKTAKSASSILSRKKDRYMLSPCQTSKESQFVIVELCEDIRIDTIQLAIFEFFSGVFKDFRVSVAHAYTSDGKGWVVVGDYTAKNVRAVQVCVTVHQPYPVLTPLSPFILPRSSYHSTAISASTFLAIMERNTFVPCHSYGYMVSLKWKNGNRTYGRRNGKLHR
jgi:hypothetical protein